MSKPKGRIQNVCLNLRLTKEQKDSYIALSEKRQKPISVIIKGYLDKEVEKNK